MIYVFKTSVKSQNSVKLLAPQLNELVGKSNWNFDLEDCDNILRIKCPIDLTRKTIETLSRSGYQCKELDD